MTTLVDWLKGEQRRLKEKDAAFSRRLGISPASWCRLKSGEREPGLAVVQGALRAFPTKADDIVRRVLQFPTGNGSSTKVKEVA